MDMQLNRMNGSPHQESSYALNSEIQADSISKTFHLIKDAMEGLYSTITPKCVTVAELGCACGPNTLMLVPKLMQVTNEKFKDKEIPQIHVFLNDLYYNDFNSISRSLMSFPSDVEKKKCGNEGSLFISMTPGSYQKRIFPDNFLYFVHCANSAHWLSKVPDDLIDKDGRSLLKGYMYMVETSPPEVCQAYQKQFATDFSAFLKSRGKEVIKGGRMIINVIASSETHGPHQMWILKVKNMVIHDMISEGLVDEEKANSFNLPFYPPTMDEVNKLVVDQGCFVIDKHETFNLLWDLPMSESKDDIDDLKRARFVAGPVIAGSEYMISEKFGDGAAKEFFRRFIEYVRKFLSAGDELCTFHQVVSLVRN